MVIQNIQRVFCTFGFHKFIHKISPFEKDYNIQSISINYEVLPTTKTCLHCGIQKEKIYHCLGEQPLKHHTYWTTLSKG